MKIHVAALLACLLSLSTLARAADAKAASPTPVIPASAATVTAPLVLKDGALSQADRTDLPAGGRAVFSFTVDQAGDYVIHTVVKAPAEDSNSFYVSIDNDPQDPETIWDIDVTNGFEERVVSWRGKGDADSDEFKPKVFKLTAGAHKLIVMGREPAAELKSVSIRVAKK